MDTIDLHSKYFQRYWIHVEVGMPTSKLKKLLDAHYRRKGKAKFRKITGAHYFAYPRKIVGKKSLLVAEIVSLGPSSAVPEKARSILFRDVQEVLDTFDQKKKYDGDSGTGFVFPRDKFRFKGGFSLPIAFGADKSITDRMGVAELTGIRLAFETSPIGLESAMLSVSSECVWLSIQTGFYSSHLSGLATQTFMQAKRIGSLFVEGETN